MSRLDKTTALELIGQNIQRARFHICIIGSGTVPRFAYTIGPSESLGAELVVAGAVYHVTDEFRVILHSIRAQLVADRNFDRVVSVDALGSFTLREAHGSWIQAHAHSGLRPPSRHATTRYITNARGDTRVEPAPAMRRHARQL
jgi:hypothetical protein